MFHSKSIFASVALLSAAMSQIGYAALKPGDAAPDLATFKLEGKLPDNLKGKVVLLDFWASWCPPCRRSFPAMQELHKRYGGQGLAVVAVSVDEKREAMERFLKSMDASFATVRDADQKLVVAVDVATMPTSFVIDRRGKVRFVHNGYFGDATVGEYRQQVELLLKESAP